jgi:hypothetical protein
VSVLAGCRFGPACSGRLLPGAAVAAFMRRRVLRRLLFSFASSIPFHLTIFNAPTHLSIVVSVNRVACLYLISSFLVQQSAKSRCSYFLKGKSIHNP